MRGFVEIDSAVAVITGAGSGIGRSSALALARRGARVVVSDVDADRAATVAEEIAGAGGGSVAAACDVTDLAAVERLRDIALAEFGRVDIVMNNVGVITMGPPEAIPVEAWSRILDINILGTVRSTNTFLPLLIEQGSGHLINTASASGLLAYGYDRLPYVASKHALVGMTEALARYLRPKGIGVTCVCPSGVLTNIVEQITIFGAPDSPRAPDHAIVGADVVGDLVCEAVDTGRFLVVTTLEVTDEVARRAADIEAYLDQLTE